MTFIALYFLAGVTRQGYPFATTNLSYILQQSSTHTRKLSSKMLTLLLCLSLKYVCFHFHKLSKGTSHYYRCALPDKGRKEWGIHSALSPTDCQRCTEAALSRLPALPLLFASSDFFHHRSRPVPRFLAARGRFAASVISTPLPPIRGSLRRFPNLRALHHFV